MVRAALQVRVGRVTRAFWSEGRAGAGRAGHISNYLEEN